jgi:hypothetical protein
MIGSASCGIKTVLSAKPAFDTVDEADGTKPAKVSSIV